ncbi:hypothetical protein P154DRAFT_487776 [Amniculicola lignicola CBS 123094]|uniref:Uncharacterized protein n=1 Tax=Amniculicola lignicola CBS 123094 TaxID=1392246 RepID=A0A6A5WLW6_9PLEO|nr:hypothetical protein P154DRAFT_487776 [Amniculicola lignicola CBS 123094]
MATRIDDRWLWLGLGMCAFTFLALKAIAPALHHIVHETIVTTAPPIPPLGAPFYGIHKGKESAIKTSSLETLALSPNIDIRRAATKILCERFFSHTPSRNILLKELHSRDAEKRRRARLAFNLLCEYDVVSPAMVAPDTPRRRPRRQGFGLGGYRGLAEQRRVLPWGSRGAGDVEQRDLRRRHREAMVINEGNRPVSEEDVWMRDGEGRMSTEEERAGRDAIRRLESMHNLTGTTIGRRAALDELLGNTADDIMLANVEFWDTPIVDGEESEASSSSSNETSD